ncbi:hypothetical protein DH2020_046375 [Rehmannia glutinosa]|uniref:Uncharacterized protein n=1 Tax=Rehmannia glutinosa TaxID=99300 RepID=A0ABR0UC79_REHGL
MASNGTVKCPPPMKATSIGVFQGDNPLHYAVPLLIIQICLVVVLTRVLAYLLRPLRQPRVIAEIITIDVLARILAELKLLTTDVGRMAMSAIAVNDMVALILLALAVEGAGRSPIVSLWVFLCRFGFLTISGRENE